MAASGDWSLADEREPGGAGASDADHTIMSEGPLVAPDDAYAGLRPRDLGKALVGQTIGSVLLEEFVGGGGMGAVFRGRDVKLQRTVAVKVLATHQTTGANTARRFEIEAQSAARLDHPHIARINHVGEDHGLRYIVFEYIDGPNLRDIVVQHGPQPVTMVLSVAMQIASALHHAWKRQVVHRDIKPSNILVTKSGVAKLVDMGLARMSQLDTAEHDLTVTGATLGTFDYIAPEQARDPRDADIRSDIYSLGCTLYFLLAAKPPFPEGTALQKLLRHQGESPPAIRDVRPDVPRALAKLLGRILAKRPEDRPQDPAHLLAELVAVAQPFGLTTPDSAVLSALPVGDQWPLSRPVRRHLPWVAAVALLLGVAALLPSLWTTSGESRQFDALENPVVERAEVAPMESQLDERVE